MSFDACVDRVYFACNFNIAPAVKVHEMVSEIGRGERSKWHYVWLLPANFAANVVAIAMVPIAFLLNMVAAVVFYAAACVAKGDMAYRLLAEARSTFTLAVSQLTEVPVGCFIRIFYPPFSRPPPLSSCLRNYFNLPVQESV